MNTTPAQPTKVLVYLGAHIPVDRTYVDAVRALGEGLVAGGYTLVFGGSNEGTMTVLADAVMHNGGRAIGVFTKALPERWIYPGLTQTIVTEDLAERKSTMFSLADVILVLPGSFGTWDECFDALERLKIEAIHKRPVKPLVILNLNGFYDGIAALLQRSIEQRYTTQKIASILHFCSDVPEILAWIRQVRPQKT
ncbi:MAG: TIGR00730 family Rossman fold protein [Victivallales bacterium]|nr:TIGR00730 family Rossman fold protein [Victivallales bacterium]